MRIILTVSALALACSAVAAGAADLPSRKHARPPYPQPAAFTWTGCHVGASAGAMGAYAAFSGHGTSIDKQARVVAQAGCDYQRGRFVVGAEGEIGEGVWKGQRGRGDENVALRAGVAFDRTLVYAKAGAAFAQPTFRVSGPAVTEQTTQDRIGLLLGAGAEYAIDRHWSVKTEVDYTNYGARNVAFTGAAPLNVSVGTSQTAATVGANYHF